MNVYKIGLSKILPGVILIFFLTAGTVYGQENPEERSLYERLGGLAPISIAANDFVDVFIQDPIVMDNPAVREKKTEEMAPYIKYQLITLMCEVTGGPCQYTGLDMKTAHEGLNVSEREWERMGELFVQTLEKHGVPEREIRELVEIVGTTKDDIVVTSDR